MAFFKRVPDLPKWIASKRADGQVEYMVTTNRGMYQLNAFERRTPTGGHELAGYRLLFFPMLGLSRKVSSKKKELGDIRSAEEGVKKAAGHYRSLGESMGDQLQEALSPSEALYGFAGWLTTRRQSVTASSRHDAARWAELVQTFAATNDLEDPREGWHKELKHPTEGVSGQLQAALNETEKDTSLSEIKRQAQAAMDKKKGHFFVTIGGREAMLKVNSPEWWRKATMKDVLRVAVF